MLRIENNLATFADHLERHLPIVCDKRAGTWNTQPDWLHTIYKYFGYEEQRLGDIGKTFCSLLDQLEKTPVAFGGSAAEIEVQKQTYAAYLRVAKVVKHTLREPNSLKLSNELSMLAQKTAALKYRLEGVNGGNDRTLADPLVEVKLNAVAAAWKVSQPLYNAKEKILTERDIGKLSEVCAYSKFAKVLLADKQLQERFFTWAIRDNMGVSQFVEFPATAQRIKSAFLAARIGRLGGTMFPIEKKAKEGAETGATEKVVSLPFYLENRMQYISILDESKELVFGSGRRETIQTVLNIFSNKNKESGDFEFFGTRGIDEWNSLELGRFNVKTGLYDRINLFVDTWWEQMPVLQEVTREELEAKYDVQIDEGKWLVCGKSSRQTPDLDLDAMHGFLEVAIPTGDGKFRLYPFGNFAFIWPHTAWDLLSFIGNTLRGKISYPDENFYYSQRQIAAYPIVIDAEKGRKLMRTIQKDLIKARFGYVVFQFAGDNCAFWSQSTLESVDVQLPNLYKMKLRETYPRNPALKRIFTDFRKAPEWMQPTLFKALDKALGSHRGIFVFENGKKVFKSQKTSSVRQEAAIHHPGHLTEQILKGKLKGIVTAGH